jgi:hypothetical protein
MTTNSLPAIGTTALTPTRRTVRCPQGHDHTVTVERIVERYAYARNGNAHNPSPYYLYVALVDGKPATNGSSRQKFVVEVATDYITTGEVPGS